MYCRAEKKNSYIVCFLWTGMQKKNKKKTCSKNITWPKVSGQFQAVINLEAHHYLGLNKKSPLTCFAKICVRGLTLTTKGNFAPDVLTYISV